MILDILKSTLPQHSPKTQSQKNSYEKVHKKFIYNLLDIPYKKTVNGIDIICDDFCAELKNKLSGKEKNIYEGYSVTETQYQNYPKQCPDIPIFWMLCYYILKTPLGKIRKNAKNKVLEENVVYRKITVLKWDIVKNLEKKNYEIPSRLISQVLLRTLNYECYKFDKGILRIQKNDIILEAFSKHLSNDKFIHLYS